MGQRAEIITATESVPTAPIQTSVQPISSVLKANFHLQYYRLVYPAHSNHPDAVNQNAIRDGTLSDVSKRGQALETA